MVTLLITACDRNDLLERTLNSFILHNTFPIHELLIRDDCGIPEITSEMNDLLLKMRLPFPFRVLSCGQLGQAKSIDVLMKEVRTDFVFHSEEDWEYTKDTFIQKGLEVLNMFNEIAFVWVRDPQDSVAAEIDPQIFYANETPFYKVKPTAHSMGFSCNPHVKRTKDYISYSLLVGNNTLGEYTIGRYYFDKGFRTAWLYEGYCRHIGGQKSTYRRSSYREGAKKL